MTALIIGIPMYAVCGSIMLLLCLFGAAQLSVFLVMYNGAAALQQPCCNAAADLVVTKLAGMSMASQS